jgi:hypothetical protein
MHFPPQGRTAVNYAIRHSADEALALIIAMHKVSVDLN